LAWDRLDGLWWDEVAVMAVRIEQQREAERRANEHA
jgi:hypothetical protein